MVRKSEVKLEVDKACDYRSWPDTNTTYAHPLWRTEDAMLASKSPELFTSGFHRTTALTTSEAFVLPGPNFSAK
jgi:hypothetical protein